MGAYGEGNFDSSVLDASAERPKIVFFGSGDVAAKSLGLLSEWADIEAVVTKPQPPHHKQSFPVLTLAEKLDLKTYTPFGKDELSQLIATKPFSSKVGLVIDYGFIINQDVIDYFPLGIVNSHFSLLPEWRGADPITFSVLSGQAQTGVSLMLIVAKMDEGPLLAQATYDMPADITTPQLTADLIELSNEALRQILPVYTLGDATPTPQLEATIIPGASPSYSRKLTKADGILDFTKSAVQLEREIRAFLGWPGSRTQIGGKDVLITKAHVQPQASSNGVGKPYVEEKELRIPTSDGILVVDTLKPAGKSEMPVSAFLAGYGKNL